MKNDGDDEDNGGENSVTQVTVKEEDGCGTTICQVTLRWCRFQPKTLPLSWQCRKGNKHIFNSTCTRRDFNLKNWPFFFFFRGCLGRWGENGGLDLGHGKRQFDDNGPATDVMQKWESGHTHTHTRKTNHPPPHNYTNNNNKLGD